jgi:glucose uptake protein
VLSVVSGLLMGLFYRFVARSMFSDFYNPEPGKTQSLHSDGVFCGWDFHQQFYFQHILMYKPLLGERVAPAAYFRGGFKNHFIGILGGFIWCLGMSFNIIASGKNKSCDLLWTWPGSNCCCSNLGNFYMERI